MDVVGLRLNIGKDFMRTYAFFIGVYKDQNLAKQRITELHTFYPECQILSLSDGIDDQDYSNFCAEHSVTYEKDIPLKKKFAAKWTYRRFKFFLLNSEADVVVKIDPDTRIQRRVEFPDVDVFAPLCPDTRGVVDFNGSCFGISRSIVEIVMQSGLLSDQRYDGARLEDKVLTDVFRKLGITVTGFPEALYHKGATSGDTSGYAFVHPEKQRV